MQEMKVEDSWKSKKASFPHCNGRRKRIKVTWQQTQDRRGRMIMGLQVIALGCLIGAIVLGFVKEKQM